jgi:phage-related protein (TIGR01555 family)
MQIWDSFINLLSGLGDPTRDKGVNSTYTVNLLNQQTLETAYRGDWIARKAVDIPAMDATRQWRQWQADDPQIEELEAEEKRLGLQRKLKVGLQRARLYGGAALVMGVGADDPSLPLKPDSVKKGDLRWVHVCSRYDLRSNQLIRDLESEWYGEPEYYERTATDGATVKIHPSRVVRLQGADIPNPDLSTEGWGDSILQSVDDAVRSAGLVSGGIATMVTEAKIDVIRIPELSKNVGTKEYRDKLTTRFQFANVSKSIINTLIMDKEEEWERIQSSFQSLPDLLKMYLLIASAAVDVPSTRFLSQSPQGLSATGESDTRNYYDRIGSEQNTEVTPAISRLDEVLIRSVLGTRDPDIYFHWHPLWQMDDVQRATVAKSRADTWMVDVNAGLLDPEMMRKARIQQLLEDGTYPGLDSLVDEFDALATQELPAIDPNDPNADPTLIARQRQLLLQAPGKKLPPGLPQPPHPDAPAPGAKKPFGKDSLIEDAKPRTLYVRRDVVNVDDIRAWAKEQGFDTVVEDLHVTILYSKTAVDWVKVSSEYWGVGDKDGKVTIPPGGARIVEELGDNGAIVLLFASSELTWRHQSLIREGASSDYGDEYQPHVTITYNGAGVDLDEVEPYRGAIVLGPEIFEEVGHHNVVEDAGYKETDHPRDKNGRWATTPGSKMVDIGAVKTMQGRDETDKVTLEMYREHIRAGTRLSPLDVIHVKETGNYHVLDGHHRLYAARDEKLGRVRVRVAAKVDKVREATKYYRAMRFEDAEPDAVLATIQDGIEKTMREMQASFDASRRDVVPPPVVNVHISRGGRVIRDVEHDAEGRAVRIVETEEEAD